MSAMAALRRKRLRKTKADLVNELEKMEQRLPQAEAMTCEKTIRPVFIGRSQAKRGATV